VGSVPALKGLNPPLELDHNQLRVHTFLVKVGITLLNLPYDQRSLGIMRL